jgi:hypothetical protein
MHILDSISSETKLLKNSGKEYRQHRVLSDSVMCLHKL